MRHISIATLISVGAMLSACDMPPQIDQQADREAITAIRQRERETFSAGDRAAINELFTDDAVIMPPNEPVVIGASARDAWLEAFYRQVSVEAVYTGSTITIVGDHAYETLAFRMTITPVGGGEPTVEIGKGLHIYERQADGSWKIAVDIWNTDG